MIQYEILFDRKAAGRKKITYPKRDTLQSMAKLIVGADVAVGIIHVEAYSCGS
jgi:hypothetical protein